MKSRHRLQLVVACFHIISLSWGVGWTQPPAYLSYQGRLTTSGGSPVTTPVDVYFSLWLGGTATAPGSGAEQQLYRERVTITPGASGLFEHQVGSGLAELGSITPAMFDSSQPCFLQVAVGTVGNVLLPRQRITSVGYAFVAGQAKYAAQAGKVNKVGEVNVADFGALADCQFIADGAMSAGSNVLLTTSRRFAARDVGKSVVVAGAGPGGSNLTTTVAAFTDVNQLVLTAAASTTINGRTVQWGTDNTNAINNAIYSLTSGGTVWLGTGYYLVSSINLTNTNSINFVGACWGINANNFGTVLVPIDGNYAVLDLTGSGGIKLEDIQVGTTLSPVTGRAGILLAQTRGNRVSSLITLERVFVIGTWSSSALYVYGIGDGMILDSSFWNYNSSKYPMYFGRDNIDGITSRYRLIETISGLCNNWYVCRFEAHNYQPTGSSSGSAIRMRGAIVMNFESGLIDSSTVQGNISAELSNDGVACDRHIYTMCSFYSEGNTLPVHNIRVPSGTYSNVTFLNPAFTCTGSVRSGLITYTGFSTP